MLKKLRQVLGKIGQAIKNIFKKKTKEKETWTFYAGTMPTITTLSDDSVEENKLMFTLSNPLSASFTMENVEFNEDFLLEKLLSMPLTDLPKRYRVKTLILSLVPNSAWTGTGVDMSQYEEKSLAHFFVCRPESAEELQEEYRKENPNSEDLEWEDGMLSVIIPNATLLEYDDDIWDYTY